MKASRETKKKSSEQRYYCVVLETISDPEFTCNDENNNPWVFTSEVDAWKDIAEDKIIELAMFLKDQKEYDETLFDFDMHVIAVKIVNRMIVGVSDGFTIVHQIQEGTEIQFWSHDGRCKNESSQSGIMP